MLLWQPQLADPSRGNLVAAEEAAAGWRRTSVLRGHTDDVMDLAWAPDSSALLSGSIDNKVIVWEVSEKKRGQMISQFANHKHFVQGVAWDPAQQFVISQSADRTCKVYALRPPPAGRRNKVSQYLQPACDTAKEFYCAHTLSKKVVTPPQQQAIEKEQGDVTAAPPPPPKQERLPLFLDESAPTFFRRPAWSPDGSFLALPAGTHRSQTSRGPKDVNTAYLYARGNWTSPAAHLPAQNKPVVAVRFCPILFCKNPDTPSPPPFDKLPYKMVFAVATLDSVVLYDTTSVLPLAVLGQLHYESITEMAWSKDGQYLAVASRDGYCSIATFQPEKEFGRKLPQGELPYALAKQQQRATGAGNEAAAVIAIDGGVSSPEKKKQQQQQQKMASPTKAVPIAAAATGVKDVQVKRRIVPQVMMVSEPTEKGPAAKKAKRITPVLVQLEQQPSTAAAPPLVSIPTAVAEEIKGTKRITPTPVGMDASPVQPAFDNAKMVATAAPRTAETTAAAGGGDHPAARRRITPVPVGPPSTAAVSESVPAAIKPGSFAALAMAAGLKAASTAAAVKK